MRITISKPVRGKTRIVVNHEGAAFRFRRVLEDVDIANVPGALGPVLDEWQRKRDAIVTEAS